MVATLELWNSARTPRPPLKWAGGKRWLVPHLMRLWMPHRARRLVEPLCGGLAVALGLMPARALLNDISPHTTNFYRHLKRGLCVTIPMRNESDLYYAHRERFNALIRAGASASEEAAALFYYLNRTGYNGLCRFNSKGEFNVPFGKYARIGYTHDFTPYKEAFRDWKFIDADFETLRLARNDFVYADPPYDVEFTTYAKGGFPWDDQVRTAAWLARHKGPVILVNQATPRIRELYSKLGYDLRFLDAPRRISCDGDRTPAQEILATRNL